MSTWPMMVCASILLVSALLLSGWSHAHERRLQQLQLTKGGEFRRTLQTKIDWKPNSAAERQALLDTVAVALIGGAGRAEHVAAAAKSWLSRFSKKLFVTDVDASHDSVPEELRSVTINRFHGLGSTDSEVARAFFPANDSFWTRFRRLESGAVVRTVKQPSRNWDLAWYLAQAKYLFGLHAAMQRYPDSAWFLLADSDTFVFPDRFAQGVLAVHDPGVRVALGSFWEYPPRSPRFDVLNHSYFDPSRVPPLANGILLGGAGVLISRAAAQRLDIDSCFQREKAETLIPSDWRVTLCLKSAGIPLKNVVGMQQINLNGGCGSTGSQRCRRNIFFNTYPAVTKCPYTAHYTSPAEMTTLFTETEYQNADLCLVNVSNVESCVCNSAILNDKK